MSGNFDKPAFRPVSEEYQQLPVQQLILAARAATARFQLDPRRAGAQAELRELTDLIEAALPGQQGRAALDAADAYAALTWLGWQQQPDTALLHSTWQRIAADVAADPCAAADAMTRLGLAALSAEAARWLISTVTAWSAAPLTAASNASTTIHRLTVMTSGALQVLRAALQPGIDRSLHHILALTPSSLTTGELDLLARQLPMLATWSSDQRLTAAESTAIAAPYVTQLLARPDTPAALTAAVTAEQRLRTALSF